MIHEENALYNVWMASISFARVVHFYVRMSSERMRRGKQVEEIACCLHLYIQYIYPQRYGTYQGIRTTGV